MNRRVLAALLLIAPLGASAPAQAPSQPLEDAVQRARAEEAAASAQANRLEQAAAAAKGEAARLHAQEAAAAQGLEAAEAQITAAEAQYRLAAAQAGAYRARLATEQRPVSALLAGLATMTRRPPLLTLADEGSVDDLVELSVLLDSTLPAIRARTAALSAQLARGERLEALALSARAALLRDREGLAARQQQFAQLQRKALDRSIANGGQALSAGDIAISADERVQQLKSEQARQMAASQVARLLAADAPAPPRPATSAAAPTAPFPYSVPITAPVIEGLGAVDDSGVRSRGITFATSRGQPVAAPGAGTVRYSGPFRDYDGLIILDHGNGWLSVLVNLASPLKVGDRVQLGDPLGRTLGPLQVQLLKGGQAFSPALIAGSSASLSNNRKGG